MNIDGSNVQRLTNNNFRDSFAHWSPMGNLIAITTNRDSFVAPSGALVANFEIYTISTVDANADDQTRVTNSPGEDAHAHWSPDARSSRSTAGATSPTRRRSRSRSIGPAPPTARTLCA